MNLSFTVRDFFWLILLAAVVFCWALTYNELSERYVIARSQRLDAEDRLEEMAMALEACKSGMPAVAREASRWHAGQADRDDREKR